jgi:hypothetical protein
MSDVYLILKLSSFTVIEIFGSFNGLVVEIDDFLVDEKFGIGSETLTGRQRFHFG